MLRLDAGRIDMTGSELRPEDYAPLKRAADAGRVQLLDLGVASDPDSFWINLRPGAFAKDPRAGWMQRDELRQAISLAVDRQVFADTVYLGAGVAGLRPGHAGQQEVVFTRAAEDAARSGPREDAAGVNRPDGSQRRRRARRSAQPAGALRAAHAERADGPRAGRGGDPRRAEEDRPRRRRRAARGQRAGPAVPVGSTLRRRLFSVRDDQSGPGVEPGFLAELRQLARVEPRRRRRRRPTGSGRSTS